MDCHAIEERVESPKVRRPVRMTKPPLKREQPLCDDLYLTKRNKRTERCRNRRQDHKSQFDSIQQLRLPGRTKAIRP